MENRDRKPSAVLCDWGLDTEINAPAPGSVCVWRVDLDPKPSSDDFRRLVYWGILCEAEQIRAARFVRPRDGRRFAICRGALRLILSRLTGYGPEEIAFSTGPGGKPGLSGLSHGADEPALHFNVSHSDDLALIAASPDRELGVDVERLRPVAEARRIVDSYFTPGEQAEFAEIDAARTASAFIRGWTRKEAILKARGHGLAGLAKSFETMFGNTELTEEFRLAKPLSQVGPWQLWEAAPRHDYVAALAVRND
jgi:4'-phosphopantetheinyl transferase